MEISIIRCNNIEAGKIDIREATLNIKYAINGTGKSTLVKAIKCAIEEAETGKDILSALTPFKHRGTDQKPEISGIEKIKSIRIFDESYVGEFAFQPDELIRGSFDIFINDEDYEKGIAKINELVEVIKKQLSSDLEIDELIQDFNTISSSFGREVKTGVHASSTIAKSFKNGNKVDNIPAELEPYKEYIQHGDNFKWLTWQLGGKPYMDISCKCPFCTGELEEKRAVINKVSEVYEPKAIEGLNKIVSTFEKLSKYFSEATQKKIIEFLRSIDGYSPEQISYLLEIKRQIEDLRGLFVAAKSISFQSFKDVDKAIDALGRLRIDLELFTHLQSKETELKVNIINGALDKVIENAGLLQGSIAKQKKLIEGLVRRHSTSINEFLKSAGYRYTVDLIEDQNGQHKLKLIHNDLAEEVGDARAHLSYGEKNAFALILFMFDVLKSKPDLIVLDDPISSFDKNKKYAIVDMLFRREKSLKGRTVLMLTHDLDPILDMVYHHTDRFSRPFVTFLENKHGTLSETEITKDCIKTFLEINQENLNAPINDVSKLVYLRRLLEITGSEEMAFQVVSNLIHKRVPPRYKSGSIDRELTQEEFETGVAAIRNHIPNFDYHAILELVSDNARLSNIYRQCNSNYEKLHIYRIIFDDNERVIESDVIQKFINEAFHIENNYIYQLNPCQFQIVPQFVIDECDRYVEALLTAPLPSHTEDRVEA